MSESLEMVVDKLLRYLLSFLKGFLNDEDKQKLISAVFDRIYQELKVIS